MAKTKAEPHDEETPGITAAAAFEQSRVNALRKQEELQAKVEGAAPAAAAPATTQPEGDTYETWLAKSPEKYRTQYQQTLANEYATSLYNLYGPEITELLGAVRENPDLKTWLGRLSKKELREWLQTRATRIYDDPEFGGTQSSSETTREAKTDVDPKVAELESRIDAAERKRQWDDYLGKRRTEYQALLNTNAELQFTDPQSSLGKRVAAIIDEAEQRSRRDNRVVPYQEVYEEWRDMWTNQETPPQHAPRSQTASEPPKPQAPRNPQDVRANITRTLDKYGSIAELAAALKR